MFGAMVKYHLVSAKSMVRPFIWGPTWKLAIGNHCTLEQPYQTGKHHCYHSLDLKVFVNAGSHY